MAWRDRPYAADGDGYDGFGAGGFAFMRPTPVVGRLILVNLGVFVLTALVGIHNPANPFYEWGQLAFPPYAGIWQVWRWISYQYIHAGVLHIVVNMLFLYFFGPPLERLWGGRTFLWFYTTCGVTAGAGFAILSLFTGAASLVGASGAALGCLAACAVLFPHMMILVFFFPMPVRVAAIVFAGMYVLYILAEGDLSHAAHLAGMAGGIGWIYAGRRWPRGPQWLAKARQGAWEKKMRDLRRDEERVDQILAKIRQHGMQSLTWTEKRTLKQASERLRQFDEQQARRR